MKRGQRPRRLVISVCPRELGVVTLPITPGGRRHRLDAPAIARHLTALAAERGLSAVVQVREACAGGCVLPGPNVSVSVHPMTPPGERPDHVAIAWRTYVTSLDRLDCLATILEENLC
jgi:hypothetical protein